MIDKINAHESSLRRARGLGASKSGAEHWLKIQIAAAALIPLTLFLLTTFTMQVVFGDGGALAWLKNPFNGIGMIVLVPLGIYYSFSEYVNNGLIEDYVHHPVLNRLGLTAVTLSGIALAVIGIVAVLTIMLGA
jgi:succinate dehydrogenase / fumarate reductase membrane anchor subunit